MHMRRLNKRHKHWSAWGVRSKAVGTDLFLSRKTITTSQLNTMQGRRRVQVRNWLPMRIPGEHQVQCPCQREPHEERRLKGEGSMWGQVFGWFQVNKTHRREDFKFSFEAVKCREEKEAEDKWNEAWEKVYNKYKRCIFSLEKDVQLGTDGFIILMRWEAL